MNIQGAEVRQAEALQRMTNRIVHRGPDDEGFMLVGKSGWVRPFLGDDTPVDVPEANRVPGYPSKHLSTAFDTPSQIALGHRRLSIVDLSPHGHQPMCTHEQRYWVVYNGEIYNFREIARKLVAEGVRMHGHSDTEVLINAYATWGEACLQEFNGMFAFAIWDNKERSLFCARDRIGIKPFYYTIQNGQFIFGSDIKTLIASRLYKPEPDMEGLYLAMAFGMAPRPKTAFKDVVALEQAHWMRIHTDGRIYKQRYWSIPVGTQEHNMTEGEAVELLEDRLTESIKYRLLADVPVGTFMSGGIDSTTISAIASKLHPGIKAFTLGYRGAAPEMNEVPQARATAALNSMEHVVNIVEPGEILKDIEAWVEGHEEPYYALAATQAICGFVQNNNVRVVLSGLGGDELFAGYSYYTNLNYWRLLKKLKPVVALAPYLLGSKGEKILSIASASSADRFQTAVHAVRSDRELSSLITYPGLGKLNAGEILHNLYVSDIQFSDDVEAISYMDLISYIGNHHVHRLDQFTMAFSIEGRFPFLDHNLIEAAFRIPSCHKIKKGIQKFVLRKVSEKYIAPECLEMKKKGFCLPLKQWMEGPLKELVVSRLERLKQREYIDRNFVADQSAAYKQGKLSAIRIWHLVALELWHEKLIDNY